MKKLLVLSFVIILFGCENSKPTSKTEKISIEEIQEMFTNMKNQGSDLEQKMRWVIFSPLKIKVNLKKLQKN